MATARHTAPAALSSRQHLTSAEQVSLVSYPPQGVHNPRPPDHLTRGATTVSAVGFGSGTEGPPRNNAKRRRRPTRPLYHAEQVMEDRNLLKKKYIATQRLRRDIERSSVESLQLDVNALKQQIVDLQSMRALLREKQLVVRVNQRARRLAIVEQYWRMVEFGIGGERRNAPIPQRMKEDFIRSVMAPDLAYGGDGGVDGFLEQCRFYTTFHSHHQHTETTSYELSSVNGEAVVLSRTMTHVRVSRTTIERIFPHLLGNEWLVQLLIGRDVVYPSEVSLRFDANGTIVRIDVAIDFVVGMNNTLHYLPVVADILNGANFTESCVIIPT